MYAKNKKLKKFLCLSAAAMLAFLMCAACLLVPAKGENGPCDTGDWAIGHLLIFQSETMEIQAIRRANTKPSIPQVQKIFQQ